MEIGFVGLGRAAEQLHWPAVQRIPGVRLAAAAEPRPERRAWIVSQVPDLEVFETADELFQRAQLAAVIVSSPPDTHCELALAAAGQGIPALIEKPIATNLVQVDRLAAIPPPDRRRIAVGFNRRFWKPLRDLRATLARPAGTAPSDIELTLRTNPSQWNPVMVESELLEDLCTHQIDTVRFLFARPIESIEARWQGPQQIEMGIDLEGGVRAVCRAAYGATYEEEIKLQLKGRRFRVLGESDRIHPADAARRRVLDYLDAGRRRILRRRPSLQLSYQLQLEHFLQGLLSNRAACPGIDEGLLAARAVEAARASARDGGTRVSLE